MSEKDRETTTPLLAHPSPNGWFGGVERLRPLRVASQSKMKFRKWRVKPKKRRPFGVKSVLCKKGVESQTTGSRILI
ncbi:MAG: hypothetical protein AMJ92_10725 [candidate division Zixibacteria bacterium SM23_81]|nr:MAG: hypothetical protein AMJ92_10725 [candidate division Zixibacteria bacterium SM23_81]